MRTARRIPALLAVSLLTVTALGAPGHAEVKSSSAAETIGGPRLASHGLVYAGGSGVRKPPKVTASAYVVADATTGQVLAARDPHGHYLPASTLKVLTAVTLIPRLDSTQVIKPSKAAANVEGSAVGLKSNYRYSVSDLFHGLIMSSGNDAATALAEANGGLRRTLAQMNAEAKRLRALDTEARTTSGLNEGISVRQQHSSAYDLALMANEGLKNEDFRRYIGAKTYNFPGPPSAQQRKKGKKTGSYQIQTHNKMLLPTTWQYPGTIGGKNGWTIAAQATFVVAARRNGHTLIVSLMRSAPLFWPDARNLLTWGFSATGKVRPAGVLVPPLPSEEAAGENARADNSAPTTPAGGFGGLLPWGVGTAAVLAAGLGVLLVRSRRRRADSRYPYL